MSVGFRQKARQYLAVMPDQEFPGNHPHPVLVISQRFGRQHRDDIMLGGMLAGHDQSENEIVEIDGTKYVQFYGMSSKTAMEKHSGGVAEYRASEGKTVRIPYRGNITQTLQDIHGGIRSACTYVGAKRLKDLSKCATFVRVSNTHNKVYE